MRRVLAVAIGLAMLSLGAVFALGLYWGLVAAIVIVGLLWLAERWPPTLGLLFFTAMAAAGVVLGLSALWLLFGLVAALVAWDLSAFARYLDDVADVRNEAEFLKSHLKRLRTVAAPGWFLGAVALGVRFDFDFIWALALGLLVVVSLGWAISRMGSEGERS
ncbi:MAG: hypothetical protein PVF45_13540 [Anaerolineae bacterium]|jgi:hypothetical protein